MPRDFARISIFAMVEVLACAGLASSAFAQTKSEPIGPDRLVTLTLRYFGNVAPALKPIVTNWTRTLSAGGSSFTIVGTDPSTTNNPAVTAYLVPIRFLINSTPGRIFDPKHVLPNGKTVILNFASSPILNSGTDFAQGGVDIGNPQYVDAFQRASFWSNVSTNTNYQVPLNLVLLKEGSITASASISAKFEVNVGPAEINFFDAKWQSIISSNTTITSSGITIGNTSDTYLASGGGCCIDGYHNAFGSASAHQTFAYFTYVDRVGAFSQAVSAQSHKTGEWMDDLLVKNFGCARLLEDGDPLEGEANLGRYPYTLNRFTCKLARLSVVAVFRSIATHRDERLVAFPKRESFGVL